MGDTLRRVLCGPSAALSTPARAHVLPAPVLAPPAPAWPAGEPGARARRSVDDLVARLREMDVAVVTCAAGSCPRRPMPSCPFCWVCARREVNSAEGELREAGWEPVVHGAKRRGWRDPITGDVRSARTALELVRRDALARKAGGA